MTRRARSPAPWLGLAFLNLAAAATIAVAASIIWPPLLGPSVVVAVAAMAGAFACRAVCRVPGRAGVR